MSAVFQLGPAGYADSIEAALKRRVVLPSEFYGQLAGQARNAAFSVSRLAGIEQIQTVLESLVDDLKAGGDFEAWRRRVLSTPGLGQLTPAHLENIYRTNLQVWHSAGRARSILENRSTHPFLQYSAILDTRTRPSHAKLHGIIKPIDDPFWHTRFPPLGFQCRCQVVALTRRQAERRLREAEARGQPADFVPADADADPGWKYDRLNGNPLDSQRAALERRAVSLGEVQPVVEMKSREQIARARMEAVKREYEWTREQGIQRGGNVEFASAIDDQGRVLLRKEGVSNRIDFTPAELEQIKGATLVHNHPDGSGLSLADLTTATEFRQVVAAGHPVAGFAPVYRATALVDRAAIHGAYEAAANDVLTAIRRAVVSGAGGPARQAEAMFWHAHMISSVLAQRKAISYTAVNLPPMPQWLNNIMLELLRR